MSRPPAWRPFPIAPLLERTPGAGIPSKAKVLGVDPKQLHRWRAYNLSIDQADELACRLHLHPIEVWPDIWRAETDAEMLVAFIRCRDELRLRRWVLDWIRRHNTAVAA